MSKILYVCLRNPDQDLSLEKKIKSICDSINPDNITPHPTYIHATEKIIYGISNPSQTIKKQGSNVILGKLFENSEDWFNPESDFPDGNYAIFRSNENKMEVASDILGTRSVWYYFDDTLFVASTTQVGIIKLLGDFKFNKSLIPWVLSTGSLGPDNSWDIRIKKIPANGSVIIDRKEWNLHTKTVPVEFKPSTHPKKEHKRKLNDALTKTFKSLNNINSWSITLSGGHDSRAILLLLKNFGRDTKNNFHTITWGEKKSLEDLEGDAVIAQRVAEKLNTQHEFFPTELSEENLDVILNRFLHLGEGRIDHLAGYLDGFFIWKNLFENGVEGIIRGDELFGYNKIYSPLIVKSFMGLTLCSDFSNLKKYDFIRGLKQNTPKYLLRKNGESIHTWRDRTFHQYRIPYVQSALADLKYGYVEQINPFLSQEIVQVMREIPDELRTNKLLFKRIMTELDVDIPYSKRDSNRLLTDITKHKDMVSLIKDELSSPYAANIFPESFLIEVMKNLKVQKITNDVKKRRGINFIKDAIPLKLKKFLSQRKKHLTLDENILGFRVMIICRMHKKLSNSVS
jgi:asparagine synthetase B (glutamine-hydrolysing)